MERHKCANVFHRVNNTRPNYTPRAARNIKRKSKKKEKKIKIMSRTEVRHEGKRKTSDKTRSLIAPLRTAALSADVELKFAHQQEARFDVD
jgi:hypothetical protein